MFNDRFAQLMARQLSGEASEQEIQELQLFLSQSPQAQYFFEVFSDYWSIETRSAEDDVQEEMHFQQIIAIAEKGSTDEKPYSAPELAEETPVRVFSLKKWLAAAAFIGVMAVSWFLLRDTKTSPDFQPRPLHEVAAGTGTKSELRLPDGTKVWLNSETKLEYKANFNDSIREVFLEGEAFFDVVKDKTRPFIVHTSDIDIRVLGTAFNVKSYPKESSIEATLIHGMIEVTNKKEPSSPKVILRPHEKIVFNKNKVPANAAREGRIAETLKPFSVTSLPRNIADSAVVETSWMYNKLIFDGETLRENVLKIERWYNVSIRFKSEKVGNIPIRYQLADESIDEALKALQYIEPFNFKINGNEIEITKK